MLEKARKAVIAAQIDVTQGYLTSLAIKESIASEEDKISNVFAFKASSDYNFMVAIISLLKWAQDDQ